MSKDYKNTLYYQARRLSWAIRSFWKTVFTELKIYRLLDFLERLLEKKEMNKQQSDENDKKKAY